MGMDLDKLAGVEPAVDEERVEQEVALWLDDKVAHGRAPWAIENLGQADWAMRKVAEAERRTQAYQDEVDLWTAAKRRLTATADWLRDRLEEWAVGQRTDKAKSFPLAHGTVATRASKPTIDVVDEDALIAWAKVNAPASVHTTERCNKSELGDAARIVEVVVAYEAVNHETGDIERVPLASLAPLGPFGRPAGPESASAPLPSPEPLDEDKLAAIRARLGDGYTVNPEFDLAVLDPEGRPVPGLAVRPERVTATVTPLWR